MPLKEALFCGICPQPRLRNGHRLLPPTPEPVPEQVHIPDADHNARLNFEPEDHQAEMVINDEAAHVRMGYRRMLAEECRVRIQTHINRSPHRWTSQRVALALCSGPVGDDDWATYLEQFTDQREDSTLVIRIDPLVRNSRDLRNRTCFEGLWRLMEGGRVMAVLSAPPCSSISTRRHMQLHDDFGNPFGGPKPLRSRDDFMLPLPHLTRNARRSLVKQRH